MILTESGIRITFNDVHVAKALVAILRSRQQEEDNDNDNDVVVDSFRLVTANGVPLPLSISFISLCDGDGDGDGDNADDGSSLVAFAAKPNVTTESEVHPENALLSIFSTVYGI